MMQVSSVFLRSSFGAAAWMGNSCFLHIPLLEKQCFHTFAHSHITVDFYASDAASQCNQVVPCSSDAAVLCYTSCQISQIGVAAFLRLFLWLAELILLPSQKIWDGPGTSWDWLRIFGAQGCHAGMISSALFWLGTASAVVALCWMTGQPIFCLYAL